MGRGRLREPGSRSGLQARKGAGPGCVHHLQRRLRSRSNLRLGLPAEHLKGRLAGPRLFDIASDQIRALRSRMFIRDVKAKVVTGAVFKMGVSVRDVDIKEGRSRDEREYDGFLNDEEVPCGARPPHRPQGHDACRVRTHRTARLRGGRHGPHDAFGRPVPQDASLAALDGSHALNPSDRGNFEMTAYATFYPLGNADSTLLELANKQLLLIDFGNSTIPTTRTRSAATSRRSCGRSSARRGEIDSTWSASRTSTTTTASAWASSSGSGTRPRTRARTASRSTSFGCRPVR